MSGALRRLAAQLGARYDLVALQPPDASFLPTLAEAQARPAWPALNAWCLAGSSPLATPLAVAVLEAADAQAAHALAQVLCLACDGSVQLQACRGTAGRLALRLKTKWQDVAPGRPRQPGDAWDAGFLRDTAAGLQALSHFTPRRATLLVAHGLPAPALRTACALLHARQGHFPQAVRLLMLPMAPGLDIGRPITRFTLDAHAQSDTVFG